MTKVVGFRVLGQSLTTWAIGFSTQFCSPSNFAVILDTWSTQADMLSFFGIEKYEIGPQRKQPALAFLFVSPLTRTSMMRVRVRVQQVTARLVHHWKRRNYLEIMLARISQCLHVERLRASSATVLCSLPDESTRYIYFLKNNTGNWTTSYLGWEAYYRHPLRNRRIPLPGTGYKIFVCLCTMGSCGLSASAPPPGTYKATAVALFAVVMIIVRVCACKHSTNSYLTMGLIERRAKLSEQGSASCLHSTNPAQHAQHRSKLELQQRPVRSLTYHVCLILEHHKHLRL